MTDLARGDDESKTPKPGPTQGNSGEQADKASKTLDPSGADSENSKQRQDEILDEAVEETFPASDPISPKRIT